jgi:hypothetical protein
MKTKFALFVIFNVCIYGISFSQNTGGGESPDSLSITFIDTTQNLQVNSSIVVDSSLTVKDSVIMEDNLHVYEKLTLEKDALLRENVYVGNEIKVEKDAHLEKDAYIGNEIKVEKDAYLKKDVFVGKEIKVEKDAHLRRDVYIGNTLQVAGESYSNGTAYFNEKVFLNSLDTLDSMAIASFGDTMSVLDKPSVLFVDGNGQVLKGGFPNMYAQYNPNPCFVDLQGNVSNPTWSNGLNKIYSRCARVGIYNSNPRVALDVTGNAYVAKLAIGSANPAQLDAYFHLKASLSATSESTLFLIENNERKLMQLNNQGFLQVREVKVDLESWPDYVFEPNYNLRPLSEVKKFIVENKHLPNVPSAKEIQEKGLNLGEGNKILLEKVEEMTLYLIQMEENLARQGELLKTQTELLKIQQQQIELLQTKN